MINNRFIHFETQAQYQANRNNISSNAIVFVDEGRKIYTHGKEYGGVADHDWNQLLARIDSIENALNKIVIPDVPEDILTGVQVVDPKNGQILVYDINKHAWVNADGNFVTLDTPQTISGEKTFENGIKISDQDLGNAQIVWDVNGTDGLLIDTNGQGLYTDSNFTTNKTIIVKQNANITQDATARNFVKSGTDWMYKGGTKNDYVLLADGNVIYIGDLVNQSQPSQPTTSAITITGNNVSWKVVGKDGEWVTGSKQYTIETGTQISIQTSAGSGYTVQSISVGNNTYYPTGNEFNIQITGDAQMSINTTQTVVNTTDLWIVGGPGVQWMATGTNNDDAQPRTEDNVRYSVNKGSTVTIKYRHVGAYVVDTICINRNGTYEFIEDLPDTTKVPLVNDWYTITISNIQAYVQVFLYTTDENGNKTIPSGAPARPASTYTVYYGFAGDSISDVTTLSGSVSNKQDPKGLYQSTSTSNGQYWWIAIPTSWSLDGLEFTRNGFKFPMNVEQSTIIGRYKAYRSINTYDANSSVKVKLNEAEE